MSDEITRFIAIDEDGYFVFDGAQVTEAEFGRPLIDSITNNGDHTFTVELNGQKALVEYFDEPFIARHVEAISNKAAKIDLCYGSTATIVLNSLCLDEWDRFHGLTDKEIPFVFSRQAQMEFFDLLEEFDDDSITIRGNRIEVPPWLNPNPDTRLEGFWSNIYRTEEPRWELGREANALPKVIPQLKLNKCRILVLGCGSGHDAAYFAHQGHLVTAVDFSPEAIKRAKAKYHSQENLTFVQSDAFNLPAEWAGQFDIVFEHTFYCAVTPDRRNDVVKVWRRALAPQGHLLGIFFVMHKQEGPPFGGSEYEIRQRLKSKFEPLFWTRWRLSIPERQSKELVVYARKLD